MRTERATNLYPVILSGGSGTRLWPLSRAKYPKQFVRFDGQEKSFLAASLTRLPPGAGINRPVILCNNDHRFLVRDEAARAGIEPAAIILEPAARNTAPAIAVAALYLAAKNSEAILVVMPSDHVIKNEANFAEAVRRAAPVAAAGKLVLFGITPAAPHTGYGYIRRGSALAGFDGAAFDVEAFYEKPAAATARQYLEDGNFYWNSGIFVLNARVFLDELARLIPAVREAAGRALAEAREDLGFLRLGAAAFARAPDISVDHAVMEKTSAAAMLPLDAGWSDVGSWSSLWELAPRDMNGNAMSGEAIFEDSANCYVHAGKAFVAAIGVKDLVIASTPDAILVAEKSRAQEVGKLVAKLKLANNALSVQPIRNHRPWGHFESLSTGPRFQVKLLQVKPGEKLSLQMHYHRSEHWVVVKGAAKVTIDASEQLVGENQSVYINAGQWHRLENPGKVPLEIIEVQIGTYLGEDDIVRSEDVYNRAKGE